MLQEQEHRYIYYDHDLEIEVYNLGGIVQKFPNHFHECYVVGFVEGGKRHLWCRNREYDLAAGDLVLFNPRDNHYCAPVNGELLDYRAVNMNPEVMRKAMKEITGKEFEPRFLENVRYQSDIALAVGELYDAVVRGDPKLKKEEAFFFLLQQLLQECAGNYEEWEMPEATPELQKLCTYMENHFQENITLDDLLSMTKFGKSYLLRAFTRQIGVSPYRYLQTVRIDRAKRLLEQGISPVEAAMTAGFSDQSHFTNYFKEFIGLTPKQYQRIYTEGMKKDECTG